MSYKGKGGDDMPNKTQAMNCVLAGAGAMWRLQQDDEDTARMILEQLTSEFEPEDINYLLFRLKEIQGRA